MILELMVQAIWGCLPELASGCIDMTNSSSTYFSIAIGAVIGSVISWWVYNRQKKTSKVQDRTLQKLELLDERHEKLLNRIQQIEQHHQNTLDAILKLEKKLAETIKKDHD